MTLYRDRKPVRLENHRVRLTVLVEGGHIAGMLHKPSGVNPLWTPPWPSIEPSAYAPDRHPEYGGGSDARLLSGIMGHNLCLNIDGRTVTRGMEFGVSPMPETRRRTIGRGSLFGVPGFRWIPARSAVRGEYHAFITTSDFIPEEPPPEAGTEA
jgi:hypothetical protein